jgi:hypothetical protein
MPRPQRGVEGLARLSDYFPSGGEGVGGAAYVPSALHGVMIAGMQPRKMLGFMVFFLRVGGGEPRI